MKLSTPGCVTLNNDHLTISLCVTNYLTLGNNRLVAFFLYSRNGSKNPGVIYVNKISKIFFRFKLNFL